MNSTLNTLHPNKHSYKHNLSYKNNLTSYGKTRKQAIAKQMLPTPAHATRTLKKTGTSQAARQPKTLPLGHSPTLANGLSANGFSTSSSPVPSSPSSLLQQQQHSGLEQPEHGGGFSGQISVIRAQISGRPTAGQTGPLFLPLLGRASGILI